MDERTVAFADNVFVNCPFDPDYISLLRPQLFAVIYLGLNPRIASERLDSGETRIGKIIELIGESKFGVHDLSRIEASKVGEKYRLNMPFELGLDAGSRQFGNGQHSTKRVLVLEAERFRFHEAISDLSGSDIMAHKNDAETVCKQVRNWLANQCRPNAPGPSKVWGAFLEFMAANYVALDARGYSKKDIDELPVSELVDCMKRWVAANPP